MRKLFLALVTLLLAPGFLVSAAADTLQLKNGTVLQGKYLGGSERALQFEATGSNLQLYQVSDILSLTFTGAPQAASSDSAAPIAVAAPPSAPGTPPPPATAPAPAATATAAPKAASTTTTVPAGTMLMVRMIDSVDSKTNHVGDRFHASLESDLIANGVTVAPKGADVYGRLAEAKQAGRVAGKSQLTLELTDMTIQNRMQPIVTGDYQLAGNSRTASTAKRAGGGAAVGAIIGAIAGGGKGAAIGAGVGAGAGTATNAVTEGEQVNVPSETVLEFRLSQPFTPQSN